jgi:hypothetical protein
MRMRYQGVRINPSSLHSFGLVAIDMKLEVAINRNACSQSIGIGDRNYPVLAPCTSTTAVVVRVDTSLALGSKRGPD